MSNMNPERSITVTIIKGDVGSVGGHLRPTKEMLEAMFENLIRSCSESNILNDFYISFVGDDIALFLHHAPEFTNQIDALALTTFQLAATKALESRCYAAGQDLNKRAEAGNIRGSGLGSVRLTFVPRIGEPVIVFASDKTSSSAFSLPLAKTFLDPFTTPGLILDHKMIQGFDITVLELRTGKEYHLDSIIDRDKILALIGDTERYTVKRVRSKATNEIIVEVSSDVLSQIHQRYVGKDDPVCIARTQGGYPSTGEYTQPFFNTIIVPGWMRGSCYGAFFPCCGIGSIPTMFDGPPRVVGYAFNVTPDGFRGKESAPKIGRMEPIDLFLGHEWDAVRTKSLALNEALRAQGVFIPGRLPAQSLEYSIVEDIITELNTRTQASEASSSEKSQQNFTKASSFQPSDFYNQVEKEKISSSFDQEVTSEQTHSAQIKTEDKKKQASHAPESEDACAENRFSPECLLSKITQWMPQQLKKELHIDAEKKDDKKDSKDETKTDSNDASNPTSSESSKRTDAEDDDMFDSELRF